MRFFTNKKDKKKKGLFPLEINDIIERMRIEDIELVNTIFEIVKSLYGQDKDRTTLIDSKASSLFGMVAISVSLIFTLGGLLIEKIENIELPYLGNVIPILCILYFFVIFFMLLSNFLSLMALKARSDWREVGDDDVFKEEILLQDKSIVYKRYSITAFWKFYMNNYKINEKKGKLLKWAQNIFFISLFLLIPIVIILILYVNTEGKIKNFENEKEITASKKHLLPSKPAPTEGREGSNESPLTSEPSN